MAGEFWLFLLLAYSVIAWPIRVVMLLVVLRRQLAPGAAIAWLGIVFLHPYIGAGLYLLIGEARLRPGAIEAHRKIVAQFRHRPAATARPTVDPIYQPMILQAEKIAGMPILAGNSVEFHPTVESFIPRLTADIDAAKSEVHLLYYIFAAEGAGKTVIDALIRAKGRGVKCRVLADSVGSRPFLNSPDGCGLLTASGIEVVAAMPVTSFRSGLPRADLRNHRKLAVIDDVIAYAGSHNVVNADYGGSPSGPWVDVSGRFTGPVVAEFASVFREDWAFETNQTMTAVPPPPLAGGKISMQVVPTGPALAGESFRRLLLGAVQCARKQIILTTPYFVPDEPTMVALIMAADRGVDVKLIVPLRSNAILAAAAGRANFARLLEAGIGIYQHRPGLLHSKTATVDDAFALFGSANLDVRSFNLNFELSVLMYGSEVTSQLRKIQAGYLEQSRALNLEEWSRRSALRRYSEGAVSLLSPLL